MSLYLELLKLVLEVPLFQIALLNVLDLRQKTLRNNLLKFGKKTIKPNGNSSFHHVVHILTKNWRDPRINIAMSIFW